MVDVVPVAAAIRAASPAWPPIVGVVGDAPELVGRTVVDAPLIVGPGFNVADVVVNSPTTVVGTVVVVLVVVVVVVEVVVVVVAKLIRRASTAQAGSGFGGVPVYSKCMPSGIEKLPPQAKPWARKISTMQRLMVGFPPKGLVDGLRSIAAAHE